MTDPHGEGSDTPAPYTSRKFRHPLALEGVGETALESSEGEVTTLKRLHGVTGDKRASGESRGSFGGAISPQDSAVEALCCASKTGSKLHGRTGDVSSDWIQGGHAAWKMSSRTEISELRKDEAGDVLTGCPASSIQVSITT